MFMNWYAEGDTRIEEEQGFPVDRETLKKFGIDLKNDDGHIEKEIYYDATNGEFILDSDAKLGFELVILDSKCYNSLDTSIVSNVQFRLTNIEDCKYNDCIAFQNYYFDINNPKMTEPKVRGYSFGYKTSIPTDKEYKFNFQPLLVMNIGEKLMFRIKLLCNKTLEGKIIITLNGEEYKETDVFTLTENVSSKDIDCIL